MVLFLIFYCVLLVFMLLLNHHIGLDSYDLQIFPMMFRSPEHVSLGILPHSSVVCLEQCFYKWTTILIFFTDEQHCYPTGQGKLLP